MPTSALRPCTRSARCPSLVGPGRDCPRHPRAAWSGADGTQRASRHTRGYGAEHDRIRAQIAREEPACRVCEDEGPWIADHIVPLAKGGETTRENMQRLCRKCSHVKTMAEATAGRRSRTGRGVESFEVHHAVPVPQARACDREMLAGKPRGMA